VDASTAIEAAGEPGLECGSSPLKDPYLAFCSGSGTIVAIGGGGDLCLGDIARQTFQFGFCACSKRSGTGSQVTTDAFDNHGIP
jgi:hypothetical protein